MTVDEALEWADKYNRIGGSKNGHIAVLATEVRRLRQEPTEIDALRKEQADAVMPLIGGFLDAWDNMPNDIKEMIELEAALFWSYVATIRQAVGES